MFYKFYFLLLSFFFVLNTQSQNFENTTLCKKAYQNIIALKLDSGNYYLKQELKSNPNNLLPIYLYNYIDFLKVFTSGDMAFYEDNIKPAFKKRVSEIENSELENSPYYLYVQAEIYLHSAILSVTNKDYFTAIFHLRKALKQLETNLNKFPEFKANKKSLGLLYSILGSVPNSLKTGLAVIGLNGDIKKGMSWLRELSKDTSFENQHETATIYAFMLLHLNNEKEEAWQVLKRNIFFKSKSLMDLYSIAHIGIYGNHNSEAIKMIENFDRRKDFAPFPMIDFLMATAKTYKQEEDANNYFQKFIDTYKGLDYLKSAYQKMAWNELINGNYDNYFKYIQKIKSVGRKTIDADKLAEKEVDFLVPPNAILLKARLLSDGNYTNQAKGLLNQNDIDEFLTPKDKTEYQYRLGRIYHKENKLDSAIFYYEKTIENYNSVEAYFMANASYLIGNIYEKRENKNKALTYYEKTLKMNGFEYDNSIKQKAKAGVNRLKILLSD